MGVHTGDTNHVGIVTEQGTVVHSSKSSGKVVETLLDGSTGWNGFGRHRYIEVAEEILRKHGIRLDTVTLKAMIDAQIKEMENMELFYLADAKVEMIDNVKPETA